MCACVAGAAVDDFVFSFFNLFLIGNGTTENSINIRLLINSVKFVSETAVLTINETGKKVKR